MALVKFLSATRVNIPHEPGQWMEFKKPAGDVVRQAREAAEKRGRQGVQDLGPAVQFFAAGNKEDDDTVVRRTKKLDDATRYDPSNFDRRTLLNAAVKQWSYVNDETGLTEPITDVEQQVDEATAEWAHREIVKMITPPTAEEEKSQAA